jgi:hypothetical protein
VLAAVQIEATAEIVDACGARVVVTLLKGISLSDRDYPAPYLRPMRDIDLLVPEGAVCEVQQTLLGLGYREHPEERVESYGHHAVPLVHPRTGIWVEVHHRLFPPELGLPGVDPFRPDRVNARIRPSTFTGRLVNRLTDDLQVVYTASHWALSPSRIYNGGGVVAMLDLIHLLKRRGFLWDDVMALVEVLSPAPISTCCSATCTDPGSSMFRPGPSSILRACSPASTVWAAGFCTGSSINTSSTVGNTGGWRGRGPSISPGARSSAPGRPCATSPACRGPSWTGLVFACTSISSASVAARFDAAGRRAG